MKKKKLPILLLGLMLLFGGLMPAQNSSSEALKSQAAFMEQMNDLPAEVRKSLTTHYNELSMEKRELILIIKTTPEKVMNPVIDEPSVLGTFIQNVIDQKDESKVKAQLSDAKQS